MADFDTHTDGSATSAANPEAHPGASVENNHAPSQATSGPDASTQTTTNEPDDRSGLDRAEEVVDSLAWKLSTLASSWGRGFLRLTSRARESLQDFWAEVQDFRRGKKA